MNIIVNFNDVDTEIDVLSFKRKGRGLHKIVELIISDVKTSQKVSRISEDVKSKLYQQIHSKIVSQL